MEDLQVSRNEGASLFVHFLLLFNEGILLPCSNLFKSSYDTVFFCHVLLPILRIIIFS